MTSIVLRTFSAPVQAHPDQQPINNVQQHMMNSQPPAYVATNGPPPPYQSNKYWNDVNLSPKLYCSYHRVSRRYFGCKLQDDVISLCVLQWSTFTMHKYAHTYLYVCIWLCKLKLYTYICLEQCHVWQLSWCQLYLCWHGQGLSSFNIRCRL